MVVELEHSPDPAVALEIVLDHLSESAEYYDYLEEMETKMKAQQLSPAQLAAIGGAKRNPVPRKGNTAKRALAPGQSSGPSARDISKAKSLAVKALMQAAQAPGISMSQSEADKVATLLIDALVLLSKAGFTQEQVTNAVCGGTILNPVQLSSMQQAMLNRGREKIAELRAAGLTDKQIGELFDQLHAGLGTTMTTKKNPTKWPRKGQHVALSPEEVERRKAWAQAYLAKQKANPVTQADNEAARELELFAVNEGSLYRQRQAIEKALIGRMRKDQYRDDLAPKAWMPWIDAAAKLYVKEFGSGRVDAIFNKATRELAAANYAAHAKTELEIKHGVKVSTSAADVNERIRAIVEDPDFIRGVPEGGWGDIKTILTSLVGNDVDMVTSFFVQSVKDGKIEQFYVDDRVSLPAVQSNCSLGKVTRGQLNKAVRSLKKAATGTTSTKSKKNPTLVEQAPKSSGSAPAPKAKKPAKAAKKSKPRKATKKALARKAAAAAETPAKPKAAKAKAAKAPAKPKAVKAPKEKKAGGPVKSGKGRPAKVDRAVVEAEGTGFKVTLSNGRVLLLPDATQQVAIKAGTTRAKEVEFAGSLIKTRRVRRRRGKPADLEAG
jgi:hypothetical protein